MSKCKYTSIGGQALIEGIMMKSPEKTAICVRMPDGSIDTSYMNERKLAQRCKIFGLPIIRGVVAFVESMIQGYKALMFAADKSGFTDFEEENEMVKVSVEDNGIGIKETALTRIFDGNMQSEEGTVSDSKRNMGIGLSVCYSIVKAHRGMMKAENKPEGGARMTFALPLS
jgi:uncharacterized protein YqhQ